MKLRKKSVKPIGLNDITIVDDTKVRKAITAAALGNAMEWFDFGVYGFVAYVLGKVFFPDASPSVQMIAALGTFSVPFLIRPLGGLFFGALGDNTGRQKVLAATIVIMSLSTFAIGLIPGYASIGIWAPILCCCARWPRASRMGGEYTGASIFVAEYAPDRKRGFLGSWLDFGSIAGFVLGAGVVVLISSVLGEAEFEAWGWRLPFFLALPLGIIGLYLRHALEETPAFQQHMDKLEQGDREGLSQGPKVSFKEVATQHWRSLLTCIGIVAATNVTYYMLLTYMPSYLSHNLHYKENSGVLIIIAIMVGMLFVQPFIGSVSDKIGRKPFIIAGSIGLLLLSIPAFMLITSGKIGLIFAGLLILAVILNFFIGVMASTLPAMFPTHLRYSALASAFQRFGIDRRCHPDRRGLVGGKHQRPVHARLLPDGVCAGRPGHRPDHEGNRQQAPARRGTGGVGHGRGQGVAAGTTTTISSRRSKTSMRRLPNWKPSARAWCSSIPVSTKPLPRVVAEATTLPECSACFRASPPHNRCSARKSALRLPKSKPPPASCNWSRA